MKRFFIGGVSALLMVTGGILVPTIPASAQLANVKHHLNSLPTTRVAFVRGTNSKNITGADNRIYILRARKGQNLTLKINSLGARASVTLYGNNGKAISPVFSGLGGGEGKSLTVKLPVTGDYYIVGGGGPSFHLYDFTVTIK
ncbi:hypothetical protein [Calothrix sp. NIES-3974]|uniref:hypothetical protein n=1 Tax=Calothrix sp. NIES-3974 TaxID=2005462 RepID=UPI000B5FEE0D|nr:hypothetical protein [Calothrix sp. NIES-3974]BAZ04703.1 hypothetical protein NIES3974_13460 [Calothrix sp. NIES-3974]